MSASDQRFRPRTTPAPLLALILGLPVVFALAGLSAWELAASNRQEIESYLSGTAKAAAMSLDAKLTGFQAAGLALTETDEVRAAEVPAALQSQAKRIAAVLGIHIVLQETAAPGRSLLNTLRPPGAPLVPRLMQPDHDNLQSAVEKAAATGEPRVTDIFVGSVSGKRTMAVVLPVITNGSVDRIVIMAFTADNLATWLGKQIQDGDEFAGIRDGQGRIVAAFDGIGGTIGHPVADLTGPLRGNHGILEGRGPTGVHMLYAYQYLGLAPSYAVVVARPVNGIMAVLKGPSRWLVALASAMVMLGMLSLVALWMRRDSENAALQEVNRLLSDVPAILYVNRVFPDGRFRRRFLSVSAERVTGWPNEQLQHEGMLAEKTDPADAPGRRAFFRIALETGRSQFEYRMQFADGSMHWMRSVGVCLGKDVDGSGDVLGFITDITEERAMRDELRRTEKFALLGEVAGRVSHEVNQPMAAISMAVENGLLALGRTPPNLGAVRDKLIRIERQVERVIAIIGHISTFSRRDIAADLVELDINRVIRAALAVAEPKMTAARVAVGLTIPEGLAPPKGVAVLVEQIVVNLIVNACDAYQDHPERNERVVSIEAFIARGEFVLRVADKAGGIPAEMMGTIFDPFVTSKPPGKGTGLGLSFCLATVARLGGHLTAANMDGGARFDLALPIARAPRQAAEAV